MRANPPAGCLAERKDFRENPRLEKIAHDLKPSISQMTMCNRYYPRLGGAPTPGSVPRLLIYTAEGNSLSSPGLPFDKEARSAASLGSSRVKSFRLFVNERGPGCQISRADAGMIADSLADNLVGRFSRSTIEWTPLMM